MEDISVQGVPIKMLHKNFILGRLSHLKILFKYEFFPKASGPPPLTFEIFEALFSAGLILSF